MLISVARIKSQLCQLARTKLVTGLRAEWRKKSRQLLLENKSGDKTLERFLSHNISSFFIYSLSTCSHVLQLSSPLGNKQWDTFFVQATLNNIFRLNIVLPGFSCRHIEPQCLLSLMVSACSASLFLYLEHLYLFCTNGY